MIKYKLCFAFLILLAAACCGQNGPLAKRVKIGNASGENDDPSVIQAQDGNFYLAFLSDRSGNKDIWITRSSDGSIWEEPVQITSDLNVDVYPTLLQSADGEFHLLWHRLTAGGTLSHLFYRHTMTPLSWGSSETELTSGTVLDNEPVMIIAGDELRVIFSRATVGELRNLWMMRGFDLGDSWSSPAIVDFASGDDFDADDMAERFPALVRVSSTQYFLVFQQEENDEFFDPQMQPDQTAELWISSSSDGLDWGAPVRITNDAADEELDFFPNFYFSQARQEPVISWTRSLKGLITELPLSERDNFPAAKINTSATLGIGGWLTRVAPVSDDKSLMVFVSSVSGKPQLYSAISDF